MQLLSKRGIRRSAVLFAALSVPMPAMGIDFERQSSGLWSDSSAWDPVGVPGTESDRLDRAIIAPLNGSISVSLDMAINEPLIVVYLNGGPNSQPYPNAVHGATLITSTSGCGLRATTVNVGDRVVYAGDPPQMYYGYGHLIHNNAQVTNQISALNIANESYSSGWYTLNNGTLISSSVNVGVGGYGEFEQTGGTVSIGTSSNGGSLDIGNGSIRGKYTLGGGSLTVYGDEQISIASSFVQSGGTHEVKVSSSGGYGSLAIDHQYELNGGSLTVDNNIYVDGSTEALKVTGGTLTAYGTTSIDGGMRQTGGTVDVHNVVVSGSYLLGTEDVAASSATVTVDDMSITSGDAVSTGLVMLNPGDGNSVQIGTLSANSGQFTLMSGTLNGTSHKHFGTFTWNKGTLSIPSSDLTNFDTGGVIIASYNNSYGQMVLGSGGPKALSGAVIKNAGIISMNGETISGSGTIVNRGTIAGSGTLGSGVAFHNQGTSATANVSSGTLLANGLFKIDDDAVLTKTGAGTLTINGAQSHGSSSLLRVNAGTVVMNTDAGDSSGTGRKLTIEVNDSGTMDFKSTQHINDLTINQGGLARVSDNASRAIVTANVNLGSYASSPDGKLDLTYNDLIVKSTSGSRDSTYSYVRDCVKSSRNSSAGLWQGNGITTSVANKYQGLGVAINDKGNGQALLPTLDGETVEINDVLVKFTWNGDANLDGKVDLADYSRIDGHNGMTTDNWYDGDFNYDGVVNLADYFLIDGAFIAQTGTLSSGGPRALVAVPEPGTATLLAAGLCMLAGRRRARR